MGEPDVAIGESELIRIGEYVQGHLGAWMQQLGFSPRPDPVTNTHLLERVVRVEEELKAQREIMITRFEASDRRMSDLMQTMNERFTAQSKTMDDRFTAQSRTMDDRFKSVDDRFVALNQNIGVVKWFIVTSFVVISAAISLLAILQ